MARACQASPTPRTDLCQTEVMAPIQFTVTHNFTQSSKVVWDAMLNWEAHGDWIPATRVEVDPGDPTAVGATFTGYTGYGPLTLVDRMVIDEVDWNDESESGSCVVTKLGPVLQGTAGFDITSTHDGCQLIWFEDVTVPYLPGVVSPIVNKLSAKGFEFGMSKLAKLLATSSDR